MNCSKCRYYTRSKVYGNGCSCTNDIKPCELERKIKYDKARKAKRRDKKQWK